MFLYAKLVMHIVKTQDNLEDIRTETENIPSGLEQAYVSESLFDIPGNMKLTVIQIWSNLAGNTEERKKRWTCRYHHFTMDWLCNTSAQRTGAAPDSSYTATRLG